APNVLVGGQAELRDGSTAREVAQFRVARKAPGQQDPIHGPRSPSRPTGPLVPGVGPASCGGDANPSDRLSSGRYPAVISGFTVGAIGPEREHRPFSRRQTPGLPR